MGWLAESNSVAPGLTVSGSRAFFFFRYIWGEKFIFELFSNVNFSQQLSEQYLDKNSQAQQQCGVGPGHLFCFVQLFVRYLVRKVKLLSNADFSQQIYEKYLDNYLDKYLDFALMDT